MPNIRIQAAHIIASRHAVYQPGQVVLHDGKILEVTSRCDAHPDIDLGDVALLPGLVNPHTHLEFSQIEQPFAPGAHFPQWISSVVKYRRTRDEGLTTEQILSQLRATICQGLNESRRFSVAAICDIVTMPWHVECLEQSDASSHIDPPPAVLAALEQIGLDSHRIRQSREWRVSVEAAYQRTRDKSPLQDLLGLGISPHAPYSTQWPLIEESVQHSSATGSLLVTHLAESPDELQWLRSGSGAFREVFERLGIVTENVTRPSIEQILCLIGRAPRSLIVHGNYLSDEEIQLAAKYRDRMTIVYCPRTHSHFEHASYPLEKLMQAGLPVVFGTDSRASTPDLNLWEEARHALAKHASLAPWQAFHAITQGAADALGIGDRFGSIARGYRATLGVVDAPLSTTNPSTLVERILAMNSQVTPLSTAIAARSA